MLKSIAEALNAYGPAGLFVIGVVDSMGVPLPAAMDVLLITMAAKTPQVAYVAATAATIGSIIGNMVLFRTARYGVRKLAGDEAPEGKRQKFRLWFERYGLLTVFVPAVTPIVPLPLKVFVASAGAMRTPTSRFLAVVVLARVIRYYGEAYLGLRLGADARLFLTHNAWNIGGFALGLALALAGLYRWYYRRRAEA